MKQGPARVFISHIHEDADFAKPIAAWLETTLLHSVKCFVSTDGGIPLGDRWLDTIASELEDTAIMLVLVSRASASRRWIYFEAGAGFTREIPVVPICIAGMTTAELEPPFNALQGIELSKPQSQRELLKRVGQPAHVEPPEELRPLELPTRKTPKNVLQSRDRAAATSKVFNNAADDSFINEFRSKATDAEHVVLVGTGLNILYHRGPLELLDATKNCRWEIYVANPYSPEVETRLIEEKTGNPLPHVGRHGLIGRLESLLDQERRRANGSTLVVKLFSHYPTISFFIIDRKHYFFYPYGFSKLGDYSPVIYCSRDTPKAAPLVNFLDEQYDLTKKNAVEASLVHDLRSGRTFDRQSRQARQPKLTPFAVYIIPEAGTELYKFGSRCLGFDFHGQEERESPWPARYLAGAEFGFHLTLADALYFADQGSVDMVTKEIETLAGEFRSFPLHFELQSDFPDTSSISIVCQDDSGSLEALHHELVFRCYRRAVASNYSPFFGDERAKTNRVYGTSPQRGRLMIERYHAPYILNEFRPHFSLVSRVEPTEMQDVLNSLRRELPRPPLHVNGICLVTKSWGSSHWKLLSYIRFHT